MKEYVYGARNGIYIIDLKKTMHQLADACNFLQHVVADGGNILFVGTKRQAQEIIKEAGDKTTMFSVTERWLGGTLTNNHTIQKSVTKMQDVDQALSSSDTASMKKKEIASLARQSARLHRNLDGISKMKKLPAAVIAVDVSHEHIAIREAVKLNIPIVGIIDTNSDPDDIDYPVVANDDAVRSIKIIIELFVGAIDIASDLYQKRLIEEQAAAKKKAEEEKTAREKAEKEKKEQEKKDKAAAKKKPEKKADKEKKPATKASDKKKSEKKADKKTAVKDDAEKPAEDVAEKSK